MRITILIYLTIFSLFLHGCSFIKNEEDEVKGWSARKIYTEAKKSLNNKEYETAISLYEKLESRYPFGRFAQQGQIEIAYAYYKFDEPESAIAAADRFIKLHPNHPHVDYAYYLKGLIYFSRVGGFLARLFQQDTSSRDSSTSKQAFNEFTVLIRKFPNSRYAPEARLRALFLRNNLAEYEVHAARFYLERGAYIAAVNRCKYVLEHYDRAESAPDALEIMSKAYDKLSMTQLAADSRRVLDLSYPGHKSQSKKSWWNPF